MKKNLLYVIASVVVVAALTVWLAVNTMLDSQRAKDYDEKSGQNSQDIGKNAAEIDKLIESLKTTKADLEAKLKAVEDQITALDTKLKAEYATSAKLTEELTAAQTARSALATRITALETALEESDFALAVEFDALKVLLLNEEVSAGKPLGLIRALQADLSTAQTNIGTASANVEKIRGYLQINLGLSAAALGTLDANVLKAIKDDIGALADYLGVDLKDADIGELADLLADFAKAVDLENAIDNLKNNYVSYIDDYLVSLSNVLGTIPGVDKYNSLFGGFVGLDTYAPGLFEELLGYKIPAGFENAGDYVPGVLGRLYGYDSEGGTAGPGDPNWVDGVITDLYGIAGQGAQGIQSTKDAIDEIAGRVADLETLLADYDDVLDALEAATTKIAALEGELAVVNANINWIEVVLFEGNFWVEKATGVAVLDAGDNLIRNPLYDWDAEGLDPDDYEFVANSLYYTQLNLELEITNIINKLIDLAALDNILDAVAVIDEATAVRLAVQEISVPGMVHKDFVLPVVYKADATAPDVAIAWSFIDSPKDSSYYLSIDAAGYVSVDNRPNAGPFSNNKSVRLQATYTCGGEEVTVIYDIIVMDKSWAAVTYIIEYARYADDKETLLDEYDWSRLEKTIYVKDGGFVEKPFSDPTQIGYVFIGWYEADAILDSDYENGANGITDGVRYDIFGAPYEFGFMEWIVAGGKAVPTPFNAIDVSSLTNGEIILKAKWFEVPYLGILIGDADKLEGVPGNEEQLPINGEDYYLYNGNNNNTLSVTINKDAIGPDGYLCDDYEYVLNMLDSTIAADLGGEETNYYIYLEYGVASPYGFGIAAAEKDAVKDAVANLLSLPEFLGSYDYQPNIINPVTGELYAPGDFSLWLTVQDGLGRYVTVEVRLDVKQEYSILIPDIESIITTSHGAAATGKTMYGHDVEDIYGIDAFRFISGDIDIVADVVQLPLAPSADNKPGVVNTIDLLVSHQFDQKVYPFGAGYITDVGYDRVYEDYYDIFFALDNLIARNEYNEAVEFCVKFGVGNLVYDGNNAALREALADVLVGLPLGDYVNGDINNVLGLDYFDYSMWIVIKAENDGFVGWGETLALVVVQLIVEQAPSIIVDQGGATEERFTRTYMDRYDPLSAELRIPGYNFYDVVINVDPSVADPTADFRDILDNTIAFDNKGDESSYWIYAGAFGGKLEFINDPAEWGGLSAPAFGAPDKATAIDDLAAVVESLPLGSWQNYNYNGIGTVINGSPTNEYCVWLATRDLSVMPGDPMYAYLAARDFITALVVVRLDIQRNPNINLTDVVKYGAEAGAAGIFTGTAVNLAGSAGIDNYVNFTIWQGFRDLDNTDWEDYANLFAMLDDAVIAIDKYGDPIVGTNGRDMTAYDGNDVVLTVSFANAAGFSFYEIYDGSVAQKEAIAYLLDQIAVGSYSDPTLNNPLGIADDYVIYLAIEDFRGVDRANGDAPVPVVQAALSLTVKQYARLFLEEVDAGFNGGGEGNGYGMFDGNGAFDPDGAFKAYITASGNFYDIEIYQMFKYRDDTDFEHLLAILDTMYAQDEDGQFVDITISFGAFVSGSGAGTSDFYQANQAAIDGYIYDEMDEVNGGANKAFGAYNYFFSAGAWRTTRPVDLTNPYVMTLEVAGSGMADAFVTLRFDIQRDPYIQFGNSPDLAVAPDYGIGNNGFVFNEKGHSDPLYQPNNTYSFGTLTNKMGRIDAQDKVAELFTGMESKDFFGRDLTLMLTVTKIPDDLINDSIEKQTYPLANVSSIGSALDFFWLAMAPGAKANVSMQIAAYSDSPDAVVEFFFEFRFEKPNDADAVAYVEGLIAALGSPGDIPGGLLLLVLPAPWQDVGAALREARLEFDDLTETQKRMVGNTDDSIPGGDYLKLWTSEILYAIELVNLISDPASVTPDEAGLIKAARAAYNGLTQFDVVLFDTKGGVYNQRLQFNADPDLLDKLRAAEAQLGLAQTRIDDVVAAIDFIADALASGNLATYRSAVEAARAAYDDLEAPPPDLRPFLDDLLWLLVAYEDALNISELIDALDFSGGIDLALIADVKAARAAYDLFNDPSDYSDFLATLVVGYDALLAAEVDVVEYLIDEIPAYDLSTTDFEDAVEAARAAYDALVSDGERAKITNFSDLETAEIALSEAYAIIGALDELDIGSLTADDIADVAAVRALFDAASAGAVDLLDSIDYGAVSPDGLLFKAEDEVTGIVIAMIAALNVLDLDDEDDVIAARTAFDALGTVLPGLYTVDDTDLLVAELAIDALYEEIDDVIALIEGLDLDTLSLADEAAVITARTDYDALTALQRALVTNYADLQAAEAIIADLKAAKAVSDLIDAFDFTPGDELALIVDVVAARAAYELLTGDQQALVLNYDDLETAEAYVIGYVKLLIDAIPDPATQTAVDAAREAFDALSSGLQAEVDNYDVLLAAEVELAVAVIQDILDLLDDIINAVKSDFDVDDADDILAAWNAFSALTDDQKQAVIDALFADEDAYDDFMLVVEAANLIGVIDDLDTLLKALDPTIVMFFALAPLPDSPTFAEVKAAILAALAFYDSLEGKELASFGDIDVQSLIGNIQALRDAVKAIDVIEMILNLSDRQSVIDARIAYEALSTAQQDLISTGVYAKLTDAETAENIVAVVAVDLEAKTGALNALYNTYAASLQFYAGVADPYYTFIATLDAAPAAVALNGVALSTEVTGTPTANRRNISMGQNAFAFFYDYMLDGDDLYVATLLLFFASLDGDNSLTVTVDGGDYILNYKPVPVTEELTVKDVGSKNASYTGVTGSIDVSYEASANTVSFDVIESKRGILGVAFNDDTDSLAFTANQPMLVKRITTDTTVSGGLRPTVVNYGFTGMETISTAVDAEYGYTFYVFPYDSATMHDFISRDVVATIYVPGAGIVTFKIEATYTCESYVALGAKTFVLAADGNDYWYDEKCSQSGEFNKQYIDGEYDLGELLAQITVDLPPSDGGTGGVVTRNPGLATDGDTIIIARDILKDNDAGADICYYVTEPITITGVGLPKVMGSFCVNLELGYRTTGEVTIQGLEIVHSGRTGCDKTAITKEPYGIYLQHGDAVIKDNVFNLYYPVPSPGFGETVAGIAAFTNRGYAYTIEGNVFGCYNVDQLELWGNASGGNEGNPDTQPMGYSAAIILILGADDSALIAELLDKNVFTTAADAGFDTLGLGDMDMFIVWTKLGDISGEYVDTIVFKTEAAADAYLALYGIADLFDVDEDTTSGYWMATKNADGIAVDGVLALIDAIAVKAIADTLDVTDDWDAVAAVFGADDTLDAGVITAAYAKTYDATYTYGDIATLILAAWDDWT